MNPSVLLYDPTVKKHVLQLKKGRWAGKTWIVDFRICDNPCCACSNIDFLCIPIEASADLQRESISIVLDVHSRRIYRAAGAKSSATADAFAEAVVGELDEEGWKYLYEFLLGVKQEQIEKCSARRVDVEFPSDVLQGKTRMVGFGEIFPFAVAFAFNIDSQRWVAIDEYCVSPDCECREVVLQFVRSKEKASGGFEQVKETIPAAYYNYQERTFRQARAPAAHQPSLNVLLDAVRAAWPGFANELKKRHKKLKTLFKRALQKREVETIGGWDADEAMPMAPQSPSNAMPSAKVGRNDPCPCGSGKKYKKCCGY